MEVGHTILQDVPGLAIMVEVVPPVVMVQALLAHLTILDRLQPQDRVTAVAIVLEVLEAVEALEAVAAPVAEHPVAVELDILPVLLVTDNNSNFCSVKTFFHVS